MIIYIDIDETICCSDTLDYNTASPILANIQKANDLYDAGHTIIYWTARGATTGIDWTRTTIRQLKEWQVKYHSLKMDKPAYDLLICDKVLNTKDWT